MIIIRKLLKYISLVVALTLIFVCGAGVALWFYSSKTVNASMICSNKLKYKVINEYVFNSDTYNADIYLERQNYNLHNLYQVFSCALENRPAHSNYQIFVYTNKKAIPDGYGMSILPFLGIRLQDAAYSSKEINKSIGTMEYRPMLWLPFYYRTITINIRDEK